MLQSWLTFLMTPLFLALFLSGFVLLSLFLWVRSYIRRNTLHEDYYERCAESYDKIFTAYTRIAAHGFVDSADWENIREAHWLARHFLPREIERFTKIWLEKSTDAYFLHKNIGRFGHIDIGGTTDNKTQGKIQSDQDKTELIDWFKTQDPTNLYKKHLPTLIQKS